MIVMRNRIFSLMLGALAALFILRVYAQLAQVSFQVDWMPEFDAWNSGMLPYPILFVFQLCIIGCMIRLMRAVRKGTIRPRRWKYRACFIFGGPYFFFTLFRWTTALAVLAEDPFLSTALPAFFQIVLASFILLLGLYSYLRYRNRRLFCTPANS